MPPVESAEDLESFFNEEEFAVSVEAPRGKISAIYDSAYVQSLNDPGFEASTPVLSCSTAAIEALQLVKGDVLTVNEKRLDGTVRRTLHRYLRHEPDGTGSSLLVLNK